MRKVAKAQAYITRGAQLLVFEHVGIPEAGIQVPSGTIEDGESTEAAALREAHEETGLGTLQVVGFLGDYVYDMRAYGKEEIHHRHVYHLIAPLDTPHTWEHVERYPSKPRSRSDVHVFRFFWVDLLGDAPTLIADHDRMLSELIRRLHSLGTLAQ